MSLLLFNKIAWSSIGVLFIVLALLLILVFIASAIDSLQDVFPFRVARDMFDRYDKLPLQIIAIGVIIFIGTILVDVIFIIYQITTYFI